MTSPLSPSSPSPNPPSILPTPTYLLLKTPSPTPTSDKYTLALSPTPTSTPPLYIPVLSHTLRPDPLIKLLLTHLHSHSATPPPPFPYGALILTSQRSAAALNAALASPTVKSKLGAAGNSSSRELFPRGLVIYTVGPATDTGVRDVCANHGLSNSDTVVMKGGDDAGSGEVLARGILSNESPLSYDIFEEDEDADAAATDAQPTTKKGKKKKVLFLAGETRRDVIPRLLQSPSLTPEERIQVDEMTVYDSTELDSFAFEYKGALARTAGGIRWTVVFSPMAGRGMLEGLGWLDEGTGRVGLGKMEGRRDYICCIGPTTRAYLRREFGFEADVVAEKPSPEGVREGIAKFMAGLGSSLEEGVKRSS